MISHSKTLEEMRQEAREWLEKNNFTMTSAAYEIGVSESTLRAFLENKRKPFPHSARKIMRFIEQNPHITKKRADLKTERALRLNEQLHQYFKDNEMVMHMDVYRKMNVCASVFYRFFNYIEASSKFLDKVELFLSNSAYENTVERSIEELELLAVREQILSSLEKIERKMKEDIKHHAGNFTPISVLIYEFLKNAIKKIDSDLSKRL